MDPRRVGRLWSGVNPGVGGLGGSLLGHDFVVREGDTKNGDESARGKGLGAVYTESL